MVQDSVELCSTYAALSRCEDSAINPDDMAGKSQIQISMYINDGLGAQKKSLSAASIECENFCEVDGCSYYEIETKLDDKLYLCTMFKSYEPDSNEAFSCAGMIGKWDDYNRINYNECN